MTLAVTEQATQALKELLDTQEREPDQVLRLVYDAEGNHGLRLDFPKSDDQIIEHEGETVLVLEPAVSNDLSGNVMDLKETPSGPSLTIYR